MREMILTYLPYVLIPCAWTLARIIYQPLPKDVDRLKNLDALEGNLRTMQFDLEVEKASLAKRRQEVESIRVEAEQDVSDARSAVLKYKSIADKANRERHGAVQRFRRKLKKYEES
jgi:hypothetical protein